MTTPEILPWPLKGDMLVNGRYRVIATPGSPAGYMKKGGMGVLYRVADEKMQRTCVLKMLQPSHHPLFLTEHNAVELLEREAVVQSRLKSDNNSDSFVTVFETGNVRIAFAVEGAAPHEPRVELELPFYTMELLDGYDLEQLIDYYRAFKQSIEWDVVFAMSAQAARALSLAHKSGIIHRDIKPNNLFVHERVDRHPVLKYIDFGVCREPGQPGVLPSTTKRYGAPELLRQSSLRPVEDPATDVYTLSTVIYELASLAHPFIEHQHQFALAHIQFAPPPLRSRRADTPPELDALLMRGLSKEPKERPSAAEMAEAIEQLQSKNARAGEKIVEMMLKVRESRRAPLRTAKSRAEGSSGAAQPQRHQGITEPGRIVAAESDVLLTHSVPTQPDDAATATKPYGEGALRIAPIIIVDQSEPSTGAANDGASRTSGERPEMEQELPSVSCASTDVVRRALVNDTEPDGEPFFAERTDPFARPVEEIGVVSSMASVYAAWEETQYHSSPFGGETCSELRGPRPNSGPMEPRNVATPEDDDISETNDAVIVPSSSERRRETSRAAASRRIAWSTAVVAGLLAAAYVFSRAYASAGVGVRDGHSSEAVSFMPTEQAPAAASGAALSGPDAGALAAVATPLAVRHAAASPPRTAPAMTNDARSESAARARTAVAPPPARSVDAAGEDIARMREEAR